MYYGSASRSYGFSANAGTASSYTITGLQDGTAYYCAVTAYTSLSESSFSNEVKITTASASSGGGTQTSPPTATGDVVFAMNVAGNAYTDESGTAYKSDSSSAGGIPVSTWGDIAATGDDYVYKTYRYGNLSYDIPLSKGTYTVTLKFAETYWSQAGSRLFDVIVENGVVLNDFDVFKAAGGAFKACDRSFQVELTDSQLNLDFATVKNNAMVSAIVIRKATSSASGTGNSSGSSTGGTSGGSSGGSTDPLLQGLLNYWNFDETGGQLAIDSSGNDEDAILENGAYFTGYAHSGRALRLDGIDDYADAGSIEASGYALTITCWLYAYDFAVDDARLFSKSAGPYESAHYFMLGTIPGPSGMTLRFALKTDQGGTTTLDAYSGAMSTRRWYHAAAVYDGTKMELYLDGVRIGVISKTGRILVNSNAACWIGNNPNSGFSSGFNGMIDDLRVYGRALTQAEIKALP